MMAFTPFPKLGPCPVPASTIVRVQFRRSEGEEPVESDQPYPAGKLRWDRFKNQTGPLPYDIVGYEVLS